MPTSLEYLLKVPLILVACIAAHASYTPPTPPPSEEEISKHAEYKGDAMNYAQKALIPTIKAGLWIMALFETVVILAQEYPSSYSQHILTTPSGSGALPSRVRITGTFLLGWVFIVAGGLTRVTCYRTLGRHFTFHLSVRKDHKLITRGPYSVVRHPGYSACAFVLFGEILIQLGEGSWMRECGILTTGVGKAFMYAWIAWHLTGAALLVKRIPTEDAILRKEFGAQWDEWSKRTPYTLIPYIL
ncbi:hypothetical protein OBBRIDRAFT_803183 [Obba rivulosa]|uniref:Protein-S-isoprenylcysteine O-methyltransferase n=1 Tax=Obba rivulosa TaxID=1052685 RepID=A0A8E2B0G9_9APHY|nr:hypothetical protein OBBRIDRAFT_803183 [Obba rivulosa]